MKKYRFDVNGIMVDAEFSEKAIEEIFVPMLRKWTEMRKVKKQRIIVYLVAPPGAGKSTVASFLEYLSIDLEKITPIQSVGLDGFHYPQKYLERNYCIRQNKKVLMKEIKGGPETFDIKKLVRKLEELKYKNTTWPVYSRVIHDVIENEIFVDKNIVLIEGNWLLLKDDRWKVVREYCDDSVFVYAESEQLKDRLINRKIKGGSTKEEAVRFFETSDLYNVNYVLNNTDLANVNILLNENMDYEVNRNEN